MSLFAVRGDAATLSAAQRAILFDRSTSEDTAVRQRTAALIARVRAEGDPALLEFAQAFDAVTLDALEVPRRAWHAALDGLDAGVRRALERAASNIRAAHEAFRPVAREFVTADGVVIGRRPDPLGRVGVYAPGGRATYPSSLLMGAVPARVAGVSEVVVCSPPAPSGLPSPVLLAAAAIAGADRVFAVGGAGAIAAMAYGTQTIPRVDRIVGPGNAYVAEAKLQVAGAVAIDSPAGPSELLVIADDTADVDVVALEIVAQAEHDPLAAVVLVTTSDALAVAVERRVERVVADAPRAAIVRAALAARGGLVTVATGADAEAFATRYAAEHLLVACRDADGVASRVRNAGTIFVGGSSSVAFGDYLTGANHVLPTGGLARCYSGLSTIDFYRWTTWQRVDRPAAARLAVDVGLLADAEGLPGHAAAARHWKEKTA
ncbi:MAG: histidinol dehydrogenase [Gemmatimonadetes bacterium]|nr:histidinol dehydrogenase [Gemmatimonadota bacterium]MBI3504601.1 histidinol dehydrogenase [Pseudomonadota bacterium]